MTQRRILITEDDMARLKALVQGDRGSMRRDQKHLAELQQELERAEVVTAAEIPADRVTMHSTARIRDLATDAREVYTVVFPFEADLARRRISVLAPVGTALIGYSAGDVIEWATPGGTRRLQIEAVLFQPEADGAEQVELEAPHGAQRPSAGARLIPRTAREPLAAATLRSASARDVIGRHRRSDQRRAS
jgi:regulator of nucleoside diphosphate kinase